MGDTPEEAYGRVTNPQRYGVLIPAAEQIAARLVDRFDATLERDTPASAAAFARHSNVERSLRVVPADPMSAPIAIAFTTFPGVFLRAGAWLQSAFPGCGCDACDENPQALIVELGSYVDAVTTGHFEEHLERDALTQSWALSMPSRGRGGRGTLSEKECREMLASPVQPPAHGTWLPWAER